ncbi:hypothetical protein B1161_01235 [Enterococcus faecium]|nr:hypothetical protein B1161_01235 [Enterococcus faecium]RCN88576.1 hypothetical protein B1160_01465 [Enterococcus faecium]RCT88054.1 hypothetical protein B1175_00975 [Enterococcus faecium]
MLKSLAILPSGSAGKFLKKIWNLGQLGGEEANFASVLRPPHSVPSANFCAKKCFILTVPMDRAFFFRPPFDRRFDRRFEK